MTNLSMDFIKCYLCGCLAAQERISRDRTQTIFCTSRVCGRYDISEKAAAALLAGASFRTSLDSMKTRVYLANRAGERVSISLDDLGDCPEERHASV